MTNNKPNISINENVRPTLGDVDTEVYLRKYEIEAEELNKLYASKVPANNNEVIFPKGKKLLQLLIWTGSLYLLTLFLFLCQA